MWLNLTKIEAEAVAFDFCFGLPGLRSDTGDALVVGEAHIWGRAWRSRRGIELEARWEATVRLPCSRCLESCEKPLGEALVLTLVGNAAEFGAREAAMSPEDADLFYVEGQRADLRQVVGEQVLLCLPLKPVCATDCAGLCPTCGAARNRIECGCQPSDIDPRLAPLGKLVRSMRRHGESQA